MLHPKRIPGKTYEALMEENLSKIPIYSDEWTNFNPSDPGITMLENLSAYQILQQDDMEQVPDGVKAKLLELLGYKPKKGRGAVAYLEPAGALEDFLIPADQRFLVGDISFETTVAKTMTSSRVKGVFGMGERGLRDMGSVLHRDIAIYEPVFGKEPVEGGELYLVLDKPLEPGEQGILYVEVDKGARRNPFQEEDGELMGRIAWQCYTEAGFVPMEVQDETRGFLMDGLLFLTQPAKAAARYEKDGMDGYVWKAVFQGGVYDMAPRIRYVSNFLFPVVQKETLVIVHTFSESLEVTLHCAMLEEGYVHVFCREHKDASYRLYEQSTDGQARGRLYRREHVGYGAYRFLFDRDAFGFGPGQARDAVKITIYNEEMMRRYYLGEVFGYDNQEIDLPRDHVITETFSVIAERSDGEGGLVYDFLRPGRMGECEFSYYLYENEGKIVILDPGDFVGARLYLGSIAVTLGEEGNVRPGNHFTPYGYEDVITFTNPAAGKGGCFQETLEDVRRRFVADLHTPATAVLPGDYAALAMGTPGLCIAKASAWMDYDRNEVQVTVLPVSQERFPKISKLYLKRLEQWLDAHRLLCTRIQVRQPVYAAVSVSGTIYVRPHFERCREQIGEVIERELNYLEGSQSFGQLFRFDNLFRAIEALQCVSYIYELSIAPHNPLYASMDGADIRPAHNCLLYPGQLRLEIVALRESV